MAFGDRASPATVGRTALGYGAMIAGAVLAFFWIRAQGRGLAAPAPSPCTTFATSPILAWIQRGERAT